MSTTVRERTPEEAFHRGCAVILCVIAATLAVVFGLMFVCGCALPGDALLAVPAALVVAAGCELHGRMDRAAR